MVDEMDASAAGGGWLTWRLAAVAMATWLALHVAARVADALWWRPRRLEAHFAAQGVRGPPYRFLLGSVKEMVGLMAEASSKPMSPPTSHNALPRVLAFYNYWRKIYGALAFFFFFVLEFLLLFFFFFSPTSRFRPCVASPDCSGLVFLAGFGCASVICSPSLLSSFSLFLLNCFLCVSVCAQGLSFCLFLSEQRSFSLSPSLSICLRCCA